MIIGIIHHKSTKKYLPALLKSLEGVKYPVRIVRQDLLDTDDRDTVYNFEGGYELGALKMLMLYNPEETDFFLLHETTLIKDQSIFDIAARFKGSFSLSPGMMCFLAKYRRSVIDEIGLPIPKTREAAIAYEYFWNILYMTTEKKMLLCDEPLQDTERYEMKFGKKRMVIENRYIKKWKSNYKPLTVTTSIV
jgi:hypothetical protein